MLKKPVSVSQPVDTDGDGVPDFCDGDNDGDGIADGDEVPANVNVPAAEGDDLVAQFRILATVNTPLNAAAVCRSGDELVLTVDGGDMSSAEVVIRHADGDELITPVSVGGQDYAITCPAIAPQTSELFITDLSQRSDGIAIEHLAMDTPVLTQASYDPDLQVALLSGENLAAEVTVAYNGGSMTVDNRWRRATVGCGCAGGSEFGFVVSVVTVCNAVDADRAVNSDGGQPQQRH